MSAAVSMAASPQAQRRFRSGWATHRFSQVLPPSDRIIARNVRS